MASRFEVVCAFLRELRCSPATLPRFNNPTHPNRPPRGQPYDPDICFHLECSLTGKRYSAGEIHGLSEAGRPLLVGYDLKAMAAQVLKAPTAASQTPGLGHYASLLPVAKAENRISLGEVVTPLIPLERTIAQLGAQPGTAIVKDEGRLPTKLR